MHPFKPAFPYFLLNDLVVDVGRITLPGRLGGRRLGALAFDSAIRLGQELYAEHPLLHRTRPETAERLATLTQREREIMDRVIAGKRNKAIAEELCISIKTVELHRKRVMEKLGATSATHLMKMVVSERVA